jgi:FlaA1/EpsC-like NDP-sugar epimerase
MGTDGGLAAVAAVISNGVRRLLRRSRFGPTPTLIRLAYDGGCTFGAATVIYSHGALFLGHGTGLVFACACVVLALNWSFGLYTRVQIGAGRTKAVRAAGAIALSALTTIAVSRSSAPAVLLWSALVAAPIVLPRVLLNLNVRPTAANFVTTAVQRTGPVLLVGGAGYIGTHVIAELLAANYRVRVLDRLIYGRKPVQEFLSDPRFELVVGDVTDIVKVVGRWTPAVVHLAGLVGDPACAVDVHSSPRQRDRDADGEEVALSIGVSRFVFASSCSVYGATERTVTEKMSVLALRARIDSERELLDSPRITPDHHPAFCDGVRALAAAAVDLIGTFLPQWA